MPATAPCFRRRLITLLCVAGLMAAVSAISAAASARAYVVRLGVTGATHGRALPAKFLGLALAFNQIPPLAGPTPQSVNPIFAQLVKNLDPDAHRNQCCGHELDPAPFGYKGHRQQ